LSNHILKRWENMSRKIRPKMKSRQRWRKSSSRIIKKRNRNQRRKMFNRVRLKPVKIKNKVTRLNQIKKRKKTKFNMKLSKNLETWPKVSKKTFNINLSFMFSLKIQRNHTKNLRRHLHNMRQRRQLRGSLQSLKISFRLSFTKLNKRSKLNNFWSILKRAKRKEYNFLSKKRLLGMRTLKAIMLETIVNSIRNWMDQCKR
jgi:hypothetical protein